MLGAGEQRSSTAGSGRSIEMPLMDGNTSMRSLRPSQEARRLSSAGNEVSVGRRSSLCSEVKVGRRSSLTMRGSALPTFTTDQLEQIQGTTSSAGLSNQQVEELLEEFGPNELKSVPPTPFLVIFFRQCKDPILLMLFAAALINYFGVEDTQTGIITAAYWFIAAITGAIGEWATAEGGSALASMSSAEAKVLRDGQEMQVPTRSLVPGDVVYVTCGDTIPADMRCMVATDLRIDESVLTGESQEVTKTHVPTSETTLEPFPVNMLFASTACVSGKGSGIVTATGMNSQVGVIAARLDVEAAGLSPLQETMHKVGRLIGVAIFVVMVIMIVLMYLTRYQDPKRPCTGDDATCFLLAALSQGIILGVSLVPTTMPIMVTLLLHAARKTIEKKRAIVRKTSTIETLGSCMAICSDKTGTLTEGKMTAVSAVTVRSNGIEKFAFYPTAGADPTGGIFKDEELTASQMQAIDRALKEDCSSRLPLQQYGRARQAKDVNDAHVRTLMMAASLNSGNTRLEFKNGKWATLGNLSEGALVVAAAKAGIGSPCQDLRLESATALHPPEDDLEVPFSSARKLMCTVHSLRDGMFAGLKCSADFTHVAIVKGAPDRLMPLAECSLADGPDDMVVFEPGCPEAVSTQIARENSAMADGSLRVLLLCMRLLAAKDVEQLRTLEADDRVALLTKQMAIVGAFGILDPPRPTVGPAIARCKSAGIRVVMITGDQQATAVAIGLKLEIIRYKSEARMCADMYDVDGNMVPIEELDKMVEHTRVWARAQPVDKVAIVESLQRMGCVTAMTGDGVNDAPALKLAEIGTAMGITGTEVAKGSADIVLMNDDFTTIVEAVQEGRRAYANIQIYVTFYFSGYVPEILAYTSCMFSGIPFPMSTLQIYVASMLVNTIPPLFFTQWPLDANAMKVSPRRRGNPLLSGAVIKWVAFPWHLLWFLGWMLCLCLGLWMHTGFIFGNHIVGSSGYQAVHKNEATCEFAMSENDQGHLVQDQEPFHCLCPVRTHPLDGSRHLEQWGRTLREISQGSSFESDIAKASDAQSVIALRNLIGYSKLSWSALGIYETPLYDVNGSGVESLLEKCEQGGVERWCWQDRRIAAADKPVLDLLTNCATLGVDTAQTMGFISIMICKFFLLLAIGSEMPLLLSLTRNPPLVICCIVCASVTFFLVYMSVLTGELFPSTMPLALPTLLTALGFPAAAHVGLDVFKALYYRSEVMRMTSLKIFHAQAIEKCLLSAQADDEEVAAYQLRNPTLSLRTFSH